MNENKTALYRHFDATGALLYVGISLCAINRMSQHQRSSKWINDSVRMDIEWFASAGKQSPT